MYPLIYRILLPVLPRRDPDQVLKAPGKGHRGMVAHLLPDLLHGKVVSIIRWMEMKIRSSVKSSWKDFPVVAFSFLLRYSAL